MKLLLFVTFIFGASIVSSIGIKPKRHVSGAYEYGSNLGHQNNNHHGHVDYNNYNFDKGHHHQEVPHQHYGIPQQQYHQYGVPQIQPIQPQGIHQPQVQHHQTEVKIITKEVPVHVPQPYPVTVTKKVPVPYPQPYPVHVPKAVPYPVEVKVPVHIPKPYPVKVTQQVPVKVPVYIKVPHPVRVEVPVPKPYPVTVTKEVKVPTPVYIKVPVYINRPQQTQQIQTQTPVVSNVNYEAYGPSNHHSHSHSVHQNCDVNPSYPHTHYQTISDKPVEHVQSYQSFNEGPQDFNLQTTYADIGNDVNTHNQNNLQQVNSYTNYYQSSDSKEFNGYVPSKQGGMYGNTGYNTYNSGWKW